LVATAFLLNACGDDGPAKVVPDTVEDFDELSELVDLDQSDSLDEDLSEFELDDDELDSTEVDLDPELDAVDEESELIDPCQPNPCIEANRERCTARNGVAICSCNEGFRDDGGECVPDDICGPLTCTEAHRGECRDAGGVAVCECDEGYVDRAGRCVLEDPCALTPCTEENRNVCVDNQDGTASCLCNDGFEERGGVCVAADPCTPNHCIEEYRTVCVPNVDGSFFCECDEGYVDFGNGACLIADPCTPNPCVEPHRSVCSLDENRLAVCACDDGYQLDNEHCVELVEPTCASQHDTGDAYEPDECPALATTLSAGDSQSHSIEPAGDLDYYQFVVSAGEIMEFSSGSGMDSVIALYDTDGATVLRSADTPQTLRWEYEQGGTYFARVRHYSSSATGNYTVSLNSIGSDDHGDDLDHASALSLDATVNGAIETWGDLDFFSFQGQAQHIYVIEELSSLDVVISLWDSSGNLLTSSDSPEWLRFKCPSAGTYYVKLRHYSTSSQGSYQLSIRDLGLEDHGDSIAEATPFILGDSINGEINFPGDYDYFSFEAQLDHLYLVEELSSMDVVINIWDASNTLVLSSDSPEWLRWKCALAGTYFVRVRHYSTSSIGSYQLRVTDLGFEDHGDSISEATPFTLGDTVDGNIDFYGDHDYFSFEAELDHIYWVEELSPLDVVINIWDATNTLVVSSDSPEWLRWRCTAAGTYFVRVRHYSTSSIGAYQLKVSDLGLDDHGDSSAEATSISGGTIAGEFELYGDRDVFSFTVSANGIWYLAETSSTNVVLSLIDSNGTTAIQSYDTPEWIAYRFPSAGTYFLSIRHASSSAIGTYSLDFVDRGFDDHGDVPTTATAIGIDGSANPGFLQFRGDVDYFSFSTSAGAIYAISVDHPSMRMTLYAADAATQIGQRTGGTLNATLDAMSTYYLRIDTSADLTAAYNLSVQD
jgi:hypothetical protein